MRLQLFSDAVVIAEFLVEARQFLVPFQSSRKEVSRLITGLAVQLPGWRYPVVCQLAAGDVKYDNYNGRWGAAQELDKFLQAYAVEKAKIEARLKGYSVSEQALVDGSVKLTIQVAGGAA